MSELTRIAEVLAELKAELGKARAEISELKDELEKQGIFRPRAEFLALSLAVPEINKASRHKCTEHTLRRMRERGEIRIGTHYRNEASAGSKKPTYTYHPRRIADLLNTDKNKRTAPVRVR